MRHRGTQRSIGLAVIAVSPIALLSPIHAQTVTFLDLSGGLTGWTTAGTATVLTTTDAFNINGSPYSLTPAAGNSMAKISPSGAPPGSVDSLLGLGANSIESLINNGNGSVTNFGVMTKSYSFNPGTYSFSWAYAATDYVPFNDGVLFSVVGSGSESLVSLARNGSDSNDTSGPSPGTLILGSYGTVPWQTATFTIATAGTYQVGFADYNWIDTALDPILYVSGATGTGSGTPPPTTGGGPVLVIGTTGGDVSASIFDTLSAAYNQPALAFDGGTLQYGADTTTAVDGVLTINGGTIDTQTYSVIYSGSLSGVGGLTVAGNGTLALSAVNAYTGATLINNGATLALTGAGSVATSTGVVDNGTFDISATTSGASVQSLSGGVGGLVVLGNQTLTLSNAADIFAGNIAGIGGLTVSGGAETLAGANSYTGITTIAGGATLTLSGAGSIAASSGVADSGTFDISAATSGALVRSLSGGAGASVMLGAQTLTLTNAAGTFSGSIAGSGSLTVSSGTETLAGASTYTGITAIAGGATLILSGAGNVAASRGIDDGGALDISGTAAGASVQTLSGAGKVALGAKTLTLTNASGAFAGSISGDGGVNLSGGVEALTGKSLYSGGTIVSASKLIISSDAALGAASGGLTMSNSVLENTASTASARKLTLVGAVTFLNAPGTFLQLNGQISGTAVVTKNGDGTLILGGDNRSWGLSGNNVVGGLTVNGGLVEVTNAYGLGYGPVFLNSGMLATTVDVLTAQTIQVDGDTALNTKAGTTTTLTGSLSTGNRGSCFDKTGAGTLVIGGTANLGNGACVEEGKLSVNGILNGAVTVAPSGILRGTGLINGPIAVQGILAAGNSPGTLAVRGTVTMAVGSVYQEDINGTGLGTGPGNYSRLLVTGASSQFIASGATLNADLLNITGTAAYKPYVPKLGDTFRIITAAGGIVGEFATFDQPAGLAKGTRLAIFYDYLGSDSIDLRLVPTSYATFLPGINANARSAGGALDRILTTDQAGGATTAQNELSYEISGLPAAKLAGAMTALAGELHADLAAIAPQADQWLQGSIERQLESGSAIDSTGAAVPGHALWVDTSADYGKWSGDDRASGFSDDHTQVALGIELLADQANRFGMGFSHSRADVSTFEGSGSEDANTGFVYGQYSLGRAVLDGMLGAGSGSWESTRGDPLKPTAQDLRASGHNRNSLAGAGVRWPLAVGDMVVQPYARALWQRYGRGGLDEGAAFDALSAPSYSAAGLRSLAGVSAGSANGSPLAAAYTYRVNAGIGHDSGDLVNPAISQTLAGDSFTVVAPEVGRTFGQLNVTATARVARRGYVYLGLFDEARRGKSQEEGVNLGARVNF